MKQTLHRIASIFLCLSGAASADPPTAIEKPPIAAGASWQEQTIDGMSKAVISSKTYTVQSVDAQKVQIVDESGEVAVVLDAGTLAIIAVGERQFSTPILRFSYPMSPDKRWETAYSYINPQCGKTQSSLSYKAVGWEDIKLAVGSFRALRIEAQGRWRSSCGSDSMTHRYWVAAEVALPLRHETIVNAQGRIHSFEITELLSLPRH